MVEYVFHAAGRDDPKFVHSVAEVPVRLVSGNIALRVCGALEVFGVLGECGGEVLACDGEQIGHFQDRGGLLGEVLEARGVERVDA